MGRTARGWVWAAALAVGGCQSSTSDPAGITLTQTPPTVQAAYAQDYPGTTIRKIVRSTQGDQAYYTVQYAGPDGQGHDVEYNEGGNQIDKH